MSSKISSLGSNFIFVYPQSNSVSGAKGAQGSGKRLTDEDARAIAREAVSVRSVAPMLGSGAQIVFAETSTLGMRIHTAERRVQARTFVEVETPHGKVRIKVAGDGGYAPEYEDCRKLAQESGIALKQVIAEANYAYVKSR